MDYLDVVVHVFTPETRDYYRLEQLWGDVPRSDPDPEQLLQELPVESAYQPEARYTSDSLVGL